jgi:hypothetical protein
MKSKDKCQQKGCSKKKKKKGLCSTHYSAKWRKENPIRSAYSNLRNNAKRRGKEFDLTLEEFEKFCIKTEYLIGKGRTKEGYTIDREKEEIGYTKDNIRVLTNSQNISKENKRRKMLIYEYQYKIGFYKDLPEIKKDDNIPF